MDNTTIQEIIAFLLSVPKVGWLALNTEHQEKVIGAIIKTLEAKEYSNLKWDKIKASIGVEGLAKILIELSNKAKEEAEEGLVQTKLATHQGQRPITFDSLMEAKTSLIRGLCFSETEELLSVSDMVLTTLEHLLQGDKKTLKDMAELALTAYENLTDYVNDLTKDNIVREYSETETKYIESLIDKILLFADDKRMQVLKGVQLLIYISPILKKLTEESPMQETANMYA